ncbi:MAG: hypothetical protein RIS56_1220 [Verrucomicrobiota bacterium]|jgi:hypothetical protein
MRSATDGCVGDQVPKVDFIRGPGYSLSDQLAGGSEKTEPTGLDDLLDRPSASVHAVEFRSRLMERFTGGSEHEVGPLRRILLEESDVPRIIAGRKIPAPGSPHGLPSPADGPSISQEAMIAVLEQCDGRASLGEIAIRITLDLSMVMAVVQRWIGGLLEISRFDALRERMPVLEICRWPVQEHRVAVEYWRNAIEVRAYLDFLPEALKAERDFLRYLRKLHVVSLMGSQLESLYLPDSARRQVSANRYCGPGEFRRDGLMDCVVNNVWHARLFEEGLGMGPVRLENAPSVGADGIVLGETRWTWKGPKINRGLHVFSPFPTLRLLHFKLLLQSCREAVEQLSSGTSGDLAKLAEFFRVWICLHPFAYGNMGLGMNIVNWALRRSRGGYVPHAMLDGWAHRLNQAQFERLFCRYVDRYLIRPGGGADSESRVARSATQLRAFMDLPTEQAAKAWLESNPDKRSIMLLSE